MNAYSQADENTDLTLVTRVIEGNTTIPVIVMDSEGNVADWRNIAVAGEDTLAFLEQYGRRMKSAGDYVKIEYGDGGAFKRGVHACTILLQFGCAGYGQDEGRQICKNPSHRGLSPHTNCVRGFHCSSPQYQES
jgi:hypothetical protein